MLHVHPVFPSCHWQLFEDVHHIIQVAPQQEGGSEAKHHLGRVADLQHLALVVDGHSNPAVIQSNGEWDRLDLQHIHQDNMQCLLLPQDQRGHLLRNDINLDEDQKRM